MNRRNNERSPPTSTAPPHAEADVSLTNDTPYQHPIVASRIEAEERDTMVNAFAHNNGVSPCDPSRMQPPQYRNRKWGQRNSKKNATALSHSLIQLRPDERLIGGRGSQPQQSVPNPSRVNRHSLRRWLFVYLPALLVLGGIAYIVMELVMKHFAMRTLQQQIMQLPVIPPPPSLSSFPDIGAQPTAVTPQMFPHPSHPIHSGPPPPLPEPKAMSPPMARDVSDLRSLALNGSPEQTYY
jgi:hypothetical protein